MSVNSRDKGKRYELELAGILRDFGWPCRRGQQYSGANGDADVIGLPGIHIEAKRREQLAIYDWMAQAKRDSAMDGGLPTVFFRKSHCNTLVCMELDDWMKLATPWMLEQMEAKENG